MGDGLLGAIVFAWLFHSESWRWVVLVPLVTFLLDLLENDRIRRTAGITANRRAWMSVAQQSQQRRDLLRELIDPSNERLLYCVRSPSEGLKRWCHPRNKPVRLPCLRYHSLCHTPMVDSRCGWRSWLRWCWRQGRAHRLFLPVAAIICITPLAMAMRFVRCSPLPGWLMCRCRRNLVPDRRAVAHRTRR